MAEKAEIKIHIHQIEADTYYATSDQLPGLHVENECIEDVFKTACILAQDLIGLDETSPYHNKNIIFDFEVV